MKPSDRNAASAATTARPRSQPARRLSQLYAGLALYALSMSLVIRARLGLDPRDVFHQGLARHIGVRFAIPDAQPAPAGWSLLPRPSRQQRAHGSEGRPTPQG